MESLIPLFFIGNVLAAMLLGFKFISKKDATFKMFGWGLLFNAIAFLMWTALVVFGNPNITSMLATLGSFFFVIALIMFFVLYVKSKNITKDIQTIISVIGAVLLMFLFYIRTYVYTAKPFVSEEGLFFFNLPPLMQMFYIVMLVLVIVPAVDLIASKFTGYYQALVRYGFLMQVAGGIVLLTITDISTLYTVGWMIGVAYLLLWPTLLFSKKAWLGNN